MCNYIIQNDCQHDFNSNNFYVYELINSLDNQTFYVGKGRDNRGWKHILLRNNKKLHQTNPHKFNKINSIISNGGKIIVKLVDTFDNEMESHKYEIILIEQHGRKCAGTGTLTNILRGGEGYTQDGKSVDQYTKWGEYVNTYKNAKEAARLNDYPYYSVISGCCLGRERSYKGFLWCYTGNAPHILTTKKPVYQWTHIGEFINVYESTTAAAHHIGLDPSTIGDCVRGITRQAGGYLWSYERKPPALQKNLKNRKVLHINTDTVYDTLTLAAAATKHSISDISACCKHKKQQIRGNKFQYVIE